MMNPARAKRETTRQLRDLPNVGKQIEKTLLSIAIEKPGQLTGADPLELYKRVIDVTGKPVDPCLLDVFISIVDFMDGAEAKKWWAYTAERKELLGQDD